MWPRLIPELLGVVNILIYLFVGPTRWFTADSIMFVAFIEFGMLMASATLIDIASGLKKALQWWVALPIGAAVILFSPVGAEVFAAAFADGVGYIVPTFWAMFSRISDLWTLPSADDLEKVRRRTLIFDRLYVAVILGGVTVVAFLCNKLLSDQRFSEQATSYLLLAFLSIGAFNIWRVYQGKFVKRPRSLVPWIDQNDPL